MDGLWDKNYSFRNMSYLLWDMEINIPIFGDYCFLCVTVTQREVSLFGGFGFYYGNRLKGHANRPCGAFLTDGLFGLCILVRVTIILVQRSRAAPRSSEHSRIAVLVSKFHCAWIHQRVYSNL